MKIRDILPRNGIIQVAAIEKRGVLQALSRHAASMLDMDPQAIFQALTKREELGSTGVGHGVAVPHARFKAISHACGVYATLGSPVDFGAADDERVDLVFMVMLPDHLPEQQLKPLACVARRLRAPPVQRALRRAPDASATFDVLMAD